ncbi:MAG: metallophosphoesterase [Bacteroidaceae bacterium]|nr:metallophosphoesterase [Bacteroidaceae bacterium]
MSVAASTSELALAAEPLTAPTLSPASALTSEVEDPVSPTPLIASPPVLQNYAENSIGITFALHSLGCGYVIIGREPDLSDGQKILAGGYRTAELSDRIAQIRVSGLLPATRYYYRIGAYRIQYKGGYNMKNLGSEEDSAVHHFTTAGRTAHAHFCVINDTHAQWLSFGRAIDKISELSPSCVIWNGDACNVEETTEAQSRIFLTPDIRRKDYAAEVPYLFCPGNHDYRGMANRHLEQVWMYRQPEERHARDWDLGRNFAVRMGEIALIGLDTGEDKLDTNPAFAGIFQMKSYREAQTTWLRDALQRPDIADAPYIVAFCHIPLFDDNPKHNPGDVAPADKSPEYSTDYAHWQRTCAQMWLPLLEASHCQLIVTAHQHRYQHYTPTAERAWTQLVGGGPKIAQDNEKQDPRLFPTVIEGEVRNGQLHITTHNLFNGNVQESFTISPRGI